MTDLTPLLNARSVAVIGASNSEGNFGGDIIDNMVKAGFEGEIVAVHPKEKTVHGHDCFHDLASVPDGIDCAIVALGAHAAHTLLETTTPIGQLRGKVHAFQPGALAQPIKLIATYHPAYLLRNYTQETRRKVWQDMQQVLSELDLPVPTKSS